MSDRHRAPARQVLDVVRTGPWGASTWQHRLDCGHLEHRPRRRPPGTTLACVACLSATTSARHFDAVEHAASAADAAWAGIEIRAAQARAVLAALLGTDPSAVEVVVAGTTPTLAGASVFLTGAQVEALLSTT